MQDKNKKSEEIVKTIKLLESVLKSSKDEIRRTRVKKNIKTLRATLKEMYPDANLREIENAIYSNLMAMPQKYVDLAEKYKQIKDVTIEEFSNYREDAEINEAASIMNYFHDRIWIAISDQYTKLDFSNSSERDILYRNLDECGRSFKTFRQTLEDIDHVRSAEYLNQLHILRIRHGRLFLFELHQFFRSVKKFVSNLIANHESGGNMILNPDEIIKYADYEEYKTYENWTVINALKNMLEFIDEVLDLINIPNIK